jgi:hypothetical protein
LVTGYWLMGRATLNYDAKKAILVNFAIIFSIKPVCNAINSIQAAE